MRADARRNRDKILQAARDAIAERGADAPMELIARRAGVGVGTLYRRFPDRGVLLAALAEQYVHELMDGLDRAAAAEPDAWSAVRAFVLHSAEKSRGAIAAALAGTSAPPARRALVQRLDELVRQAQADGAMRSDVGTGDITELLSVFACHPGVIPERFLPLILDGLDRRQPGPPQ
ncbi:TetR/AcrR family transcriptional regulator [Actinomadura madurae]|uniref:TetR/AcrR family transcriptional regulator n=1 Tax=Actinomadura madurae TaxID=1993 RepID=UPI0020D22285|nr:TetR/AcrR family transcriptional regulator [Actinomadura madurae]MCP9966121.1 TetR/AcrR family transcriptional regulator [Actinomadura madurae]MCQ0009866.1 TetR/AcrR family transcriptional regulator [Actinomadura madurae]